MKKRTVKERLFVKHYIESGGDEGAAYLKIYPKSSKRNAVVNGKRMLGRLSIDMNDYLDGVGLDNFLLIHKMYEGMSATKYSKTEDGMAEVPDWGNRQRFLDMAFKLKGSYPAVEAKKKEVKEKPRKATILKTYEQAGNDRFDYKIISKAN